MTSAAKSRTGQVRARIDIKKTVRLTGQGREVPRIPFEAMLAAALPKGYELSLVLCGDSLARRVNTQYRKKTYAANVLSFPISKQEGEIFLNVRASEREAKRYGVSKRARLGLLFVHGLLHLRGLPHGRTMESEERRVLRRFGLSD